MERTLPSLPELTLWGASREVEQHQLRFHHVTEQDQASFELADESADTRSRSLLFGTQSAGPDPRRQHHLPSSDRRSLRGCPTACRPVQQIERLARPAAARPASTSTPISIAAPCNSPTPTPSPSSCAPGSAKTLPASCAPLLSADMQRASSRSSCAMRRRGAQRVRVLDMVGLPGRDQRRRPVMPGAVLRIQAASEPASKLLVAANYLILKVERSHVGTTP